jgi:hypothetical protein
MENYGFIHSEKKYEWLSGKLILIHAHTERKEKLQECNTGYFIGFFSLSKHLII